MEIHEKATVRANCSSSILEGEDISPPPPKKKEKKNEKTLIFSTMVTFYGSLHIHLDFGLSEGSFQSLIIDIR